MNETKEDNTFLSLQQSEGRGLQSESDDVVKIQAGSLKGRK